MHVKRMLLSLLLVFGGLVSTVGAVETDPDVRHLLEVETRNGKVWVQLIVQNNGDTTVYVPREVAAGDKLTGRRFDLREVNKGKVGKTLDYTGMMVKRGAFTAADYQAVAPKTMHMNTIDITPAYAFRKGKHDYEIRYDGPYLTDVNQLDAVRQSPAAPVKFSFSK